MMIQSPERPHHTRSTLANLFPLLPFKRWIRDQGKSSSTAESYASYVRTVFRSSKEVGEARTDPARVQKMILEVDESLAPSSRKVFRAAIRTFDSWLHGADPDGGWPTIAPTFPDGRRGSRASRGLFAPDPLDSLRWLAPLLAKIQTDANPDIPWQRIAELKWKHVEAGGGGMLKIKDPGWGRAYSVPREEMLKIAYWVGNDKPPDPELPIIPREPGSPHPLPAAILRKLARM